MKKLASVILVLFMTIGVFTACAQPQQSTAAKEPVAEPVTDESGVKHEPVTISYMRHEIIDDTMERQIISEFQEKYPWITVEIMNIPSHETYNKLLLSSQAGNPPDVFWSFWTAGAAANGLMEDLGPYVSEEDLADFNKDMLGICELDGVLYALPWRSSSNIYMCNVDVVKNAGLEMPDDKNWKWEEFKTFIKAIHDNSGSDVYGLGFAGASSDAGTEWEFKPWLLTAGGHMMNENNTRAAFNSPEGVEALTFLCNLVKEDLVPPGVTGTNTSILEEMQASNKLCMWQDGAWMLSTLRENHPDLNMQALYLPTKDGYRGNIAGGTAIGMAAKSQHKEEAWLFIEFLCSKENMLRWCTAVGALSGRESNWTDEYYQTHDWQVNIDQLKNSDNIFPANAYYDNETLNQILRDYLGAAYSGQMTPEDALNAAANEWNEILSEHYPD